MVTVNDTKNVILHSRAESHQNGRACTLTGTIHLGGEQQSRDYLFLRDLCQQSIVNSLCQCQVSWVSFLLNFGLMVFKFSQYYFYDGTFSLSFSCKHDRRILLLLTSCKNHAPFLRMVDPLLQATNKINMAFQWETNFFLERKWNATFRGHCERTLCGSLFPWFVLRGLAKIMTFCST